MYGAKIDAAFIIKKQAEPIESGASQPRLVCWLPVVDEVRTKIYSLSREIIIPTMPEHA